MEKTDPAKDVFPTEAVASALNRILLAWREALLEAEPGWAAIARYLSPQFKGSPLTAAKKTARRANESLQIWDMEFQAAPALGPAVFMDELSRRLDKVKFVWAEFKVTAIEESGKTVKTRIRYDLVDTAPGYHLQQRVGWVDLVWVKDAAEDWAVIEWRALRETCSRSVSPVFQEITSQTLGANVSFREQLARGTDYWRTLLDGACGIDIYGNFGVAAGDFDNDGWDDLYICQPSGLPNRLYHNRGDGTFEDVTGPAGVGVIDSSPAALFADTGNTGLQDLIVVRGTGPLLFRNQGNGTFRLQPDAFHFAAEPQGTFTGAAIADYDRDGWLDIYFCLYSYYQGPDRYRYPVPYYNAQNGPANFLFHNNRDGTFSDVTREAGLNQNNNRFSFACSWCDYDQDGWPDLYVANDFGQKNLYHNNGNGTFTDVAEAAGVLDTGAGMSVCWLDYDDDGKQDIYVADMWTAAGLRLTSLDRFMAKAPPSVRQLYRKHAMGNSLFRNDGHGGFEDVSTASGAGTGGWAWSSDTWDFDHDGYPDLYVANGMISGPRRQDLSSFFWRQVVACSPLGNIPTSAYEDGWNAINELIRSDGTWSGYERNVFYANNRNGTFSDVSGAVGLDAIDDSRSFALADVDHDGRLEIILKNRTGPQVRVFHNVMPEIGHSVSFKLTGRKSNWDAIGATVTVRSAVGEQVKSLQAGSGFLAQHSKEMFFGLGHSVQPVRASVRWPNGAVEQFENVPANHSIEVEEGAAHFKATPYVSRWARNLLAKPEAAKFGNRAVASRDSEELPAAFETWLVVPLDAPGFSLPDLKGQVQKLSDFQGSIVLLNFWTRSAPSSVVQLQAFQRHHTLLRKQGINLLAVNTGPPDSRSLPARMNHESFPILQATPEMTAVYNLLYRYTFDRRRDLSFPVSFLVDEKGRMVKIYQGPVKVARLLEDVRNLPRTPRMRQEKALPFPGTYYGGAFVRNYFTFGVAFAQHGYSNAAEAALRRAIREEPQSADAYYDLGTLYMKEQRWDLAVEQLQKAVQLKPSDLMGFNNLGVIAARQGRFQEAARYFNRALTIDAGNALAIQNLADLDRTQGRNREAMRLLERALRNQPDNPELNYKLGMVFAGAGHNAAAGKYLERAVELQPDYAEALDNLGVLYVLMGQPLRAVRTFSECIRREPKFDQAYLNLARVDIKLGKKPDAAAVLHELLKEIPGHPLAQKYLRELGE